MTTRVIKPNVDIYQQESEIVLVADMPGVAAEGLEITLERSQLTLHGKAAAWDLFYQRAFTLSQRIDRDNIEATISNGVLNLVLPLAPQAQPRQIAVKTA